MKLHLKKLRDQVIVLTGASSGIGLVTARRAARRGARLVLAARSEDELRQLANEINAHGGQAVAVAADVSHEEDVRRLAEAAQSRFGGFDTWVNNAGVTILGRLEEVSLEDMRRLFDINFWGIVYGSLTAVRHLRQRGGALINMGSIASHQALPFQGIYSASKHAVKAFTDALRMELEEDRAPVSVSLIKPTSIATPLPQHAKNYLPHEPTFPPPVYATEIVADAILHCAEHPERDLFVGGGAKAIELAGKYGPRTMDKYFEAVGYRQQQTDEPRHRGRGGNLERPSHDLSERGRFPRRIRESSLYTRAAMHPLVSVAALAGAGLAIGGVWSALRAARSE
jgi:short-subunit dehydrogenase